MTHARILLIALIAFFAAACAPNAVPAPTLVPPTLVQPVAQNPTPAPLAITDTPAPEVTTRPIATAPGTPTPTQTATITTTAAISATPSATITDTTTPTITATPPTVAGIDALVEKARAATLLPPGFTLDGTPIVRGDPDAPILGTPAGIPSVYTFMGVEPPVVPGGEVGGLRPPVSDAGNCAQGAPGGFGDLERVDPSVRARLGCPTGAPPAAITANSAYQTFERGFMLWVEQPNGNGTIYAVQGNGSYRPYADTWDAATDPERGDETPPSDNLQAPARGFGKVWRDNPAEEAALGWATSGEVGDVAVYVVYERGVLLYAPQRGDMLALGADGAWRGYAGAP